MKRCKSRLLRTLCPILALLGTLTASGLAAAWPDAKPVFPLTINASGKGWIDQNGIPFLIVGDTAWSLISRLNDQDLTTYFANRRARGVNTLLVQVADSGEFGGPANVNGDLPFATPGGVADFSNRVEAYWARVDAILDMAEAEGFLVLLTPMYVGFNCGVEGWASEMQQNSLADHTSYGNFLGGRYANRDNIIWVHGGDVDASTCNPSLDSKLNEIANRLRATAPSHFHTAHCSRENQALDCYNETWLSLNNVYSACQSSSLEIRSAYQDPTTLPHFYIEGRYENETSWSLQCLKSQLYWPALGGLQGSVYGNRPIWLFDPGWPAALSDPGANLVERYARLLKSRNWPTLVPDYANQVVTSGFGTIGTPNYVAAARTSDNRTLMAYAPVTTTLIVDLSQLATNDMIDAWSYDTTTGVNTSLGAFQNSGSQAFSVGGGSVLVLDDRAQGFGPPGTQIFFAPEPVLVPTLLGLFGALTWVGRKRPRTRS